MLDRTVAIKNLHPCTMQGQTEFHKELKKSLLNFTFLALILYYLTFNLESWLISLVYEYFPGGNLQARLFHNSTISPLNWKIRARIIANIASGLLFLLSSKPEKLVHGILKLENGLLDSENSCRISDCGVRMLITNKTLLCPSFRHCAELIIAFAYQDPEFHRTGTITLLVWINHNPATHRKNSSRRLVDLGLQCCELNSRDRPELSPTLVRELERLPVLEEQPVPSFFLCPILKKIMHDPQVAADGFTYEGEALRGWLENGHETSPMTNLKLCHLNLTPNHALQIAIQDCREVVLYVLVDLLNSCSPFSRNSIASIVGGVSALKTIKIGT
ncbi:U-box domain-containing 33-like isoform X2 [Olea europaea subsp. europaea]|uniref:RING-type E3 ubiquitin transferase n=1 Tax=Olea europaea subsp. europaea TaxID=158383 RepID=A0A8S0S985_OLEEU|nr:U-box domain-containing 33-like isoform X2 [Olea europaea subsp. europaea]